MKDNSMSFRPEMVGLLTLSRTRIANKKVHLNHKKGNDGILIKEGMNI
jgi:hypothetical protein